MNVLDLFMGTGSATQPFRDCLRGHRVVGVDIDPRSPAEIRCDVRKLPRWVREYPWDFVWASPPCTEFSTLTNLRKKWPGKTGPRPEIGMETVRPAFEVARSARHFVVENVAGSVQRISQEFGRPSLGWAGRWCWTDLEFGLMNPPSRWWRKFGRRPSNLEPEKKAEFLEMLRRRGITSDTFAGHTRARSMIPRPLAEAVHRAVCG